MILIRLMLEVMKMLSFFRFFLKFGFEVIVKVMKVLCFFLCRCLNMVLMWLIGLGMCFVMLFVLLENVDVFVV